MAVVSCHLNFGREYNIDENLRREHTEKFVIQCDADYHSPYDVSKLAQRVGPHELPKMYTKHPRDKWAYVVGMSVVQRDGAHRVFDATVKYDSTQNQSEPTVYNIHPLNRPVKYFTELMQFERPLVKDIFGNAIQNACAQPFDPPLMYDDARQVLVGIKNVASLGEVVSLQQFYKDAVNTNMLYGARPRQAKVVSITSGEQQMQGGIGYYEVAIRVAFKEDGLTWDREILNQGMSRLVKQANGEYKLSSKDKNGELINSPILLADDGTQLEDDAEPVFLKFRTYPERDFRGLGI